MTIRDIPERLQINQYVDTPSNFRMFRHTLDQNIDTHWHQFFELGLVVSGTGVHKINGTPLRLERGHTFLLTPADFHQITPDPGQTLQLYNLIFTEGMISEELSEQLFERRKEYICLLEPEAYVEAEREYERILNESAAWQEHSGIIVKGCIERLLVDLSRSCTLPVENMQEEAVAVAGEMAGAEVKVGVETLLPVHPSIRKALLYLQHHFRNPLLLAEVAQLAGLSANYFSESFSKQTGFTFQAYVRDMRLQFAKSLISTTSLPITEICFASGFNTLPYFERAFKARYGLSPRGLRNRASQLSV
ncbi:AraC family transcriptional regulator [Paenibacillus eucommiae]|uniref:AraC-like DNA-binding protein n=1 Tax=Paenibacillus eucommiae TaxID=1355755 RepID=A0ABS4J3X4_9BACL|nr:AraC family transcriptional regulator [Paenibacillus eucommiae]MBP1994539.1 AraC-like DNA-binding protein [Paenibacillus eucommiae]